MIENFSYILDDGQHLKVDLSGSTDLLINQTDEDLRKLYSSDSIGILWEYNKKTISLYEHGIRLDGIPDPSSSKVVVIFPDGYKEFSWNQNTIIFNPDGTEHKRINPPNLISELASDRKVRLGNKHIFPEISAVSIQRVNNNLKLCLSISFDQYYWETRVLNTETGVFGECVGSGMR